jgi:DNA polymerase III subunit epsilon
MKTKILFFDLETTGLNNKAHGIHQLSGMLEVDGRNAWEFDYKMKPMSGKQIEPQALAVSGLTEADLEGRMPGHTAFLEFTTKLNSYVKKFDKTDKIFLAGYNNAAFDNQFLRQWFLDNGEKYFGSFFWANTIDVMVMATDATVHHRHKFPNFQLGTVAPLILGEEIAREGLHDAMYDILLTRAIYNKVRIHKPFISKEVEDMNNALALIEQYNEWLLKNDFVDADVRYELPQDDLNNFVMEYLKK